MANVVIAHNESGLSPPRLFGVVREILDPNSSEGSTRAASDFRGGSELRRPNLWVTVTSVCRNLSGSQTPLR